MGKKVVTSVRHGESETQGKLKEVEAAQQAGQQPSVTYGGATVPLSAFGRLQCAVLGQVWKEEGREPSDANITSRLRRSQQTFEIVSAEAGWGHLEKTVVPAFDEQEYGPYAHMTEAQRAADDPDYPRQRIAFGFRHYKPPGGESWQMVHDRVKPGVDLVRQLLADGKTVTIWGHIVAGQLFRLIFEELTWDEILAINLASIPNCYETSYKVENGILVPDRLYYRPAELIALS